MTLTQILSTAARLQATGDAALVGAEVRDFAAAVTELLADDGKECGMPLPTITYVPMTSAPLVVIPDDAAGPWNLSDARGFARALLATADKAERT